MESKKNAYAGKIQQSGSQEIKAPMQQKPAAKKGSVIKGTDLRTGEK